jgi:LPS export ABC transporter permease LptG/LPS export ABC transporter permease LptF
MRFFPRINRYLFGELLTPTLLALSLYSALLLMNQFFLVAEQSLSKNLGWDLTSRMFLVQVPKLFILSIPMAILLGVLLAAGRLSADHEWVALQGAGQGPWRLLRPTIVFGLLTSLLSFGIYAWAVPRANHAFRSLRGEMIFAGHFAADLKPRVFYDQIPGSVLYVEDIQPGTDRRLRGVLMAEIPADRTSVKLFLARYGDVYPDPDGSATLILDLFDGTNYVSDPEDPENYTYGTFSHEIRRISLGDHLEFLRAPPKPVVQDLYPGELLEDWRTARDTLAAVEIEAQVDAAAARNKQRIAQRRLRTIEVEVWTRLALPLACLLLAVLALPLGLRRVRSGKGAGFALSLVVILVYWAFFTFGRNQAVAGRVAPWLGTWSANIVIGVWALYANWALNRRDTRRSGWIARGVGAIRAWVERHRSLRRQRRLARTTGAAIAHGSEHALAEISGTPNRFVRRLDQYVAMTFIRVLVFSVASAYTIYALLQLKTLVDDMIKNEQSFTLVLQYFQYFAPGVLHIVLPISCLVGAVVTFSLLGRTGELTATKAIGVSMRRATLPVLVLTAIASALLFVVQDRIAPSANRSAEEVLDQLEGRPPRSYRGKLGRWSFGPEGRRLYHYRLYDGGRGLFRELSVLTLATGEPRLIDQRYARTARWADDSWEVEGGWYRTFSEDPDKRVFTRLEGVDPIEMAPPDTFAGTETKLANVGDLPEQLSIEELKAEIKSLEGRGFNIARLRVDYYAKYAHALAPLVMVLLGLPFAFKVGRRGSLYGVGVALVLVLVYWATLAIFNALGLETVLDPLMAAWAPNVLFGLLGVYLMLFIRT